MLTDDDLRAALADANVQAFARVIRRGESNQDDSAYTLLYGGGHFSGFADHPRKKVTAKGNTSTAAGAYQAMAYTWDDFVKAMGPRDFSPESQDMFFAWCVARRKALGLVRDGHLKEALEKCSWEWASMPPARYGGQSAIALEECARVYEQYGGKYAEQPPAPVEESQPMIPAVVAAVVPELIKAAPDLIRVFGKSNNPVVERNAQVAEKVAEMAVSVTGAVNAQDAVEKIQQNPEDAAKFRAAVADSMDQWLGMVTRLAEIDERSRSAARQFYSQSGERAFLQFGNWLSITFVQFLSLLLVFIGAYGAWMVLASPTLSDEIKAAVVTLIIIGGFTGVVSFWLGASHQVPRAPAEK